MKARKLFAKAFKVVALMEGEDCPAHSFLNNGEATQRASRLGLAYILQHVAASGLQNIPSAWSHEVNKEEGIFEFIKGDLRLLYFKGKNGEIAVCCEGHVKKGQKVNKAAVEHAVRLKKSYLAAVDDGSYQLIEEGGDVD